jgi:Leucine Rich repeat
VAPRPLTRLAALTHLQLARCVARTEALSSLLRGLALLRHLDIRFAEVNHPDDLGFATALGALPQLTSMVLADSATAKHWEDRFLHVLAPALARLSSLQQLDLAGACLGAGGVQAVAAALQAMHVHDIALHVSLLGPACLAVLDALAAGGACQRLALKASVLQDGACMHGLHARLAALPALQHLQLRILRSIKPQEVESAAWPAVAPPPLLTHLTFTDASADQQLCAAFLSDLAALSHLAYLAAERVGLSDAYICGLAFALPRLPALRTLRLYPHATPQPGFADLAGALGGASMLTSLVLSNHFRGRALLDVALARELSALRHLRHLDLSWHSLRSAGADALAAALPALPALLFLSFASCDFSARALAAVAACLGSLPSLERLDMPDCGLPDHYAIHDVAPALQPLAHITGLMLGGNLFGDAGVSALARAWRTPRACGNWTSRVWSRWASAPPLRSPHCCWQCPACAASACAAAASLWPTRTCSCRRSRTATLCAALSW